MTISLTDLKAKRAAMTQGPYGVLESDPDGYGELRVNAPTRDVALMPDDEMADDNATGIVATHNAADDLIEIAEAALAVSEQDGLRDSKATYALRAALAKVKL